MNLHLQTYSKLAMLHTSFGKLLLYYAILGPKSAHIPLQLGHWIRARQIHLVQDWNNLLSKFAHT